jgi:hypothetical protein
LPVGDPARCPQRCVSDGIAFTRAALGLDPTEEQAKYPGDPEKLLAGLKADGEPAGGTVELVPLERLVDELSVGPAPPTLLVDVQGHFHLLLGKIDVDGQSFFEIAHGPSVRLLATAEMTGTAFASAWQPRGANTGIPVNVGKGSVRLDKVLHNFGEIKPNSNLECTFQITNTGSCPVELARPVTSCKCTSTVLTDSTKLQPGATIPLGVAMRSGDLGCFRQSVFLKFREKDNSVPRQLALSLYGFQRQLKRLSTNKLDFGVVIPNRSYSRTVSIEEVATDRFALTGFEPGKLPLTHKIEDAVGPEGYRLYRVVFELTPDDAMAGKQTGQAVIITDGRFSPEVVIDVAFEVPPLVSVRPSILAFGDVPVGKPVERRVRFEPRTPGPVAVQIDTAPQGADVRLEESSDGNSEMIVTVSLAKAGIWQGTIKGSARVSGRAFAVEVPCVAVGVEP